MTQRAKDAQPKVARPVQACRWLPWTRPARRSPSPRRRAPPATRVASAPRARPHTRWKVWCSACSSCGESKHCTPADRLRRLPGVSQGSRSAGSQARSARSCWLPCSACPCPQSSDVQQPSSAGLLCRCARNPAPVLLRSECYFATREERRLKHFLMLCAANCTLPTFLRCCVLSCETCVGDQVV